MSDVSANQGAGAHRLPTFGEIGAMLRRGDLALAVGVMTILVVLILPLPPMLLDLCLAISIIISVLILMTALFIHTPLEFSVLPDRAADRDHAAARAQPRLDAPDPRRTATKAPPPPATSSRRSAISSWAAISSSASSSSRSW